MSNRGNLKSAFSCTFSARKYTAHQKEDWLNQGNIPPLFKIKNRREVIQNFFA